MNPFLFYEVVPSLEIVLHFKLIVGLLMNA